MGWTTLPHRAGRAPWRGLAYAALLAAGVLAGRSARTAAQTTPANPPKRVFTEAEVDSPVEPVRFGQPIFPPDLQTVTDCGWANLGYIVGPDGRVERGSIVVLRASHPEFGRAAGQAILRSLFNPARRRGDPVRQRVVQRVVIPRPGAKGAKFPCTR